jgi:tetratricopeptide (TPR) repeat protein
MAHDDFEDMGPEEAKRLAAAFALTAKAIECSDISQYEKGEKLLRKALELAPDNDQIVENYVNYCLQIAENNLVAFEQYDEAIRYYKKALEFSEGDASTWMDLGTAHAYTDQPVETLEAWQKALEKLDPREAEDREDIQRLLENIRMVQQAAETRGSRKQRRGT